ncbi:MAG: SpoIIIAH-like family protein [Patescibacteria group bacterium]
MTTIQVLHARRLALLILAGFCAALIWGGGCGRPRPRGTAVSAALTPAPPARDPSADSTAAFRLARDAEHSRQREALETILTAAETAGGIRDAAEEAIWRLTKIEAAEHQAEALLALQGWEKAAVSVAGGEATVVIRGRNLTSEEAARIGRLVAETAGLAEEAVKIVERP